MWSADRNPSPGSSAFFSSAQDCYCCPSALPQGSADETMFPSLTEPKDLVEAKVLADSEQMSDTRALWVGRQGMKHPKNNKTHGSKGDIRSDQSLSRVRFFATP